MKSVNTNIVCFGDLNWCERHFFLFTVRIRLPLSLSLSLSHTHTHTHTQLGTKNNNDELLYQN